MPDGALPFDVLPGLALGTLGGFAPDGHPVIATPAGERVAARAVVPLAPADAGRELVWARVGGEDGVAVVLGVLRPPLPVAEIDGDATVIAARERLELRCGPASVTLFADGRVEVRGTQILSRAEGAQRLQGGSIHLN